jgi:hypothetical protein
LLGLRDESLDNKPKIAIVMKKNAVAYTNNFKVNIVIYSSKKYFLLIITILLVSKKDLLNTLTSIIVKKQRGENY